MNSVMLNSISLADKEKDKLVASVTPHVAISATNDAEACASWLRRISAKGSVHTVNNYRKEAERFLLWLDHHKLTFHLLTVDHVSAYTLFLSDPQPTEKWINKTPVPRNRPEWRPFQGPLKSESVRQARVILGNLFQYLADANYLPVNVFKIAGGYRRKKIQARKRSLDAETVGALWQWMTKDRPNGLDQRGQMEMARQRWLVALLYFSGIRLAEVVTTSMGDFECREGRWFLHVVGKGSKPRVVTVTDSMVAELRMYRLAIGLAAYPMSGENTPLIGSVIKNGCHQRVGEKRVYQLVKAICECAANDLEATHQAAAAKLRQVSTHWFRHGNAFARLNAGQTLRDVCEELGHESMDTTRIYIEDDTKQRHDRLKNLVL